MVNSKLDAVLKSKRIVLLCGHYGSGKTNIAVNLAYRMRELFPRVSVADLDIVNPYFRSLDSKEDFDKRDIGLICSPYANTNLDAPALPQEMYSITDDRDLHVVIDVGGDERGALALGRISDAIRQENNYEMILVVNRYRPLTPDVPSTVEVMREIEAACSIRFTSIVNDSNLGEETEAETVLNSLSYCRELSQATGLPVLGTAVTESLYDVLSGKVPDLLTLQLQKKPIS